MVLHMTKIYKASNHILIHTGYADPERHRHMAAQIILSMGGKLEVHLEETIHFCYGAVIPSGVSHRIDSGREGALVFLFDGTTRISGQIQKYQALSEETCRNVTALFAAFENSQIAYSDFYKVFLQTIGIQETGSSVTDFRILEAITYIRSALSEPITCYEAAQAVCLSQSRFSHLFRKETGMTFAAFLIYQRILYVYDQHLKGLSITEAAINAGFSSSSHFADVNRSVFGLSASKITHDCIFRTAEI